MLASAADSSTISPVKSLPKKVVPMIHVPDVRATVSWYEKIGFTVKATYADETGDNFSFAILSFGEATEVMFSTDGETSDSRRREVDLYVYTDRVDELYELLKDSVDVVEKPHDLRLIYSSETKEHKIKEENKELVHSTLGLQIDFP